MAEEDWDIKAHPNNPNGNNGKDQERKVRLTDQNFFIQRIYNIEARFARSPAYMYAAIGYLEKKQLQRNINLSNTRRKEVINEMGEKAYMLDDGYRVLDDINLCLHTQENTEGIEVARLAREVHKHQNTKTCRKHNTTCRFEYNSYPTPLTIIVRPCTGGTQEDIDAKLAMYRRVLTKVTEVLEDEDQIKKIMEKYKKQEESKEEYKKKINQE
jgi:hypothetical protein